MTWEHNDVWHDWLCTTLVRNSCVAKLKRTPRHQVSSRASSWVSNTTLCVLCSYVSTIHRSGALLCIVAFSLDSLLLFLCLEQLSESQYSRLDCTMRLSLARPDWLSSHKTGVVHRQIKMILHMLSGAPSCSPCACRKSGYVVIDALEQFQRQ